MPDLWLIGASADKWIEVYKGIRAAREALGLPAGREDCKPILDLYRQDGPCVIGAHDDSAKVAMAGTALAAISGDHAIPAVDPEPEDIEAIRRGGVANGVYQPRPGEERLVHSEDTTIDPGDEYLFEQRLYDTSMLLMVLADGSPIKAYLSAKRLQEAAREPFFELVADAIRTTFDIQIEEELNA